MLESTQPPSSNPVLLFGIYKTLYLTMFLCAKDMNNGVTACKEHRCSPARHSVTEVISLSSVRELLSCSDLSAQTGKGKHWVHSPTAVFPLTRCCDVGNSGWGLEELNTVVILKSDTR